jgi:hypothetical protein
MSKVIFLHPFMTAYQKNKASLKLLIEKFEDNYLIEIIMISKQKIPNI